MYSGLLRTYLIIGLIILIVGALVAFYFYRESILGPSLPQPEIIIQPTSTPATELALDLPSFTVEIKSKRTVIVKWSYLPLGTLRLAIFRTGLGSENWVRWKTVTLKEDEIGRGQAEINLGSGENASDYRYYAQAYSSGDNELWISSSTEPQYPSTSTPPGGPSGGPETTSSPPAGGLPPTAPPSGEYYYSPQGQTEGAPSPTPTSSFWVMHVNRKIEVGWQNLPASSTKLIVYRSASDSGPWETLLIQNGPNVVGPDYIRLDDFTIYNPHYYFAKAFNGSEPIEEFGPLYLPALEQ